MYHTKSLKTTKKMCLDDIAEKRDIVPCKLIFRSDSVLKYIAVIEDLEKQHLKFQEKTVNALLFLVEKGEITLSKIAEMTGLSLYEVREIANKPKS